ncbi:MAG TPA: hypothetical protein VJB11_02310 [archaeon]|nr:hypothetical protein [archaeon]
MSLTYEQIAEIIRQNHVRWEELKKMWYELKLPGSPFSPEEFVISLFLSQMDGSAEDIAESIKKSAQLLSRLKNDTDLYYSLMSSSISVPTMALAILGGNKIPDAKEKKQEKKKEPGIMAHAIEAQQQIEECPHCGHRFELCAEGAYLPDEKEEEKPAIDEISEQKPVAGCEHIGSDGKCIDCTDDRTVDCSDCGEPVVLTKAHKCKDYEQCENAYCEGCKDNNISEHGYCDDCSTIECDRCGDNIDRREEHKCKNPNCREKEHFCDECGPRFLNAEGMCPDCSGEEENNCNGCNETFTNSVLTKCSNYDECETAFCDECKPQQLNQAWYCDECLVIECSECSNEFDRGDEKKCKNPGCRSDLELCDGCAASLLNSKGLCHECSGEELDDCSGCSDRFIESRLKKCRKHNECGSAYCPDCRDELENGFCPDCR